MRERLWLHEQQPSHLHRTRRRRAALGHHGAVVQAGPALAPAGLAHRRALRRGRRDPAAGRAPPATGRVPARDTGLRGAGLRRHRRRAERRYHPDQRHPCRPADRHGPGAGRDHRGGVAPRRGAPGRLGGLRAVAGRRRRGHRRQRRGGERRRRRAGARVAAAVGHVHRGPGPAAERPRPDRRDRRSVPGRRPGRAAVRGGHRGRSGHARRGRPGPGYRGAGGRRHSAAVRPVRLRTEPGARRGGRGLPQHRAAGRGGRWRGVLR